MQIHSIIILQLVIKFAISVNFPLKNATSALLVGNLLGFVVAVADLLAPAVDAGHQTGGDGLHHAFEHVLVGIHLLPSSHDCSPELWFGFGVNPLDFMFENSPDLERKKIKAKRKLQNHALTCSIGQMSLHLAACWLWGILSSKARQASRAAWVLWMEAGSSCQMASPSG